MFDVIERLKAEWTDKFVVIDSPAPELARFAATTGIVKTVNMNGRCLVEFDQFNNIGWYDIDPAYLKVVPKPLPKPAAESKPKPATAAAAKEAPAKPAPKPATGGKPSTADILAAARGKAGGAAAAKPAGKLSTADILAAARAKKAAAAESVPAEAPVVEPAPQPEPVVEPPAPAKVKAAAGSLPTTTAEKIAWCRANDVTS
ncbi:MAG: hypothetical protein WD072_05520 [Pirellulales bacterium]